MRTILKIILWLAIIALAGYAVLVGLVYYWELHIPTPAGYDSIIVLGAEVQPTGEPSVQLQSRLEVAAKYYGEKPCPIICCGAQGGREPAPEGEIMRNVLLTMGVAENQVYAETQSGNTRQNLENAKLILDELGCEKPLIVTSDYHVKRAMALAADSGLTAEGAGSPCRPEISFWLKNHCREAIAWMKYAAEKCLGIRL